LKEQQFPKSMKTTKIEGVYTATVTPLLDQDKIDLEAIPRHLNFLWERGSHGALLLGTTGEGPSFSRDERKAILKAGRSVREVVPDFGLLAGTGTPSLTETISFTREAFDLGYDGVVVLPPYYFHQASIDGMVSWFGEIITQAVPENRFLLGYHIPAQSGVGLPMELLVRLKEAFPEKFAGIKDSSGDPEHTIALEEQFGKDLTVMVGSDGLFTHVLAHQGAGCITALANLSSPDLREIWDAYQGGKTAPAAQEKLTALRFLLSGMGPYPPLMKALLAAGFDFPHWDSRLPLVKVEDDTVQMILGELDKLGLKM